MSIQDRILRRVLREKRGVFFFTKSFINYGEPLAIRRALNRLVKKGKLCRVMNGIYVRQKIDPVIGILTPGIDEIAKAIVKKNKKRIAPTGITALNELGLSTQVPARVIYLTNGASRTIKIGNRTLTFKKTAAKNVSAMGKINHLVIQALRVVGKNNVTESEVTRIRKILKYENQEYLKHDSKLAPAWIREIMES